MGQFESSRVIRINTSFEQTMPRPVQSVRAHLVPGHPAADHLVHPVAPAPVRPDVPPAHPGARPAHLFHSSASGKR